MKRESFVFGLSGTLFGLMVGWILGSQQASGPAQPAAAPTAQAAQAASPAGPEATPVDEPRVAALEKIAAGDPKNAEVRAELGNIYFDASKPELAIPWYEAAFRLNGKSADLSTDLAVAYFYTSQTDRALKQLDASLAIDPRHLKALLNQGIVRAMGKKDFSGAAESWQKVIALAPASDEAKKAQEGLDGLKGHPAMGAGRGGRP